MVGGHKNRVSCTHLPKPDRIEKRLAICCSCLAEGLEGSR